MSRVFKRCCKGEQSLVREEGVRPLASFDAVTQRRHHAIRPDRSFRPPPSPRFSAGGVSPLLSLGGTIGVVLLHAKPRASSFLPPFPQGGFASRPSRRQNGCGIMKALTPDALTPNVRSLRLLRLAFPTFRPHPRWLSRGRFVRRLSAEGLFQASTNEQARHSPPPNQVRYPTDCQFTSGCSPPRLTATQSPSITELRPTPERTHTVLSKRPHGRTRPCESRDPYRVISQ